MKHDQNRMILFPNIQAKEGESKNETVIMIISSNPQKRSEYLPDISPLKVAFGRWFSAPIHGYPPRNSRA